MNTHYERRNKSSYRMYTLCHRKKSFCCLTEKYFLCRSKMQNHSFARKYSSCDTHSTLLHDEICPYHKKTSCDREYISCDKRSTISVTEGFFSCETKNISCDRKIISCDRHKKEHLLSQHMFPVNERIFLVTGIKFLAIGRTKNTSCHINDISCSSILYLLGCEDYHLMALKTAVFDFYCPLSKRDRGHQQIDPLTVYFWPI